MILDKISGVWIKSNGFRQNLRDCVQNLLILDKISGVWTKSIGISQKFLGFEQYLWGSEQITSIC